MVGGISQSFLLRNDDLSFGYNILRFGYIALLAARNLCVINNLKTKTR